MIFLDGFPLPPPGPEYAPGPIEDFIAFLLAYLFCVMAVLLLLPRRWTGIVFGRKSDSETK